MGLVCLPGAMVNYGAPDLHIKKDTGCRLSPSCLDCVRPKCVLDEPRGMQGEAQRQRDAQMADMVKRGLTQREIAVMFGVHPSTVERGLKRGVSRFP